MRVRFTDRAVSDLAEVLEHYDAIDSGLGTRFTTEVDAAVDRVRMFPMGAAPVAGAAGVRRARLRRFPYGVVYRAPDSDEEVWVLRVLHMKRDLLPALGDE